MTPIRTATDPADRKVDAAQNKFEVALFQAGNQPVFDPSKIRGNNLPVPFQDVQPPKDGSITYTPLGSDKPVTVKEKDDPTLYKQVLNQYQLNQKSDAHEAGIVQSQKDGYALADSSTVAPGLANYKAIGAADEVGPGLIRYETFSGEKVVVSQKDNPTLFDQVSQDHDKLIAINQSEAEGYRLAGPNETFDAMHLVGAPEEVGPGLIRYETDSGQKIIVSRDMTPELYNQAANEYKGVTGAPGASDNNWIDKSGYAAGAKDWDKITGNTGTQPTQEELDLNRPIAAAEMISANWNAWGLHDAPIDFANPPSSLPPEAQAALKYVASSPSLMAALDTGGRGKADAVITHADVDRFIGNAKGDLSAASSSYSKFLGNNPGDLAKANAKSAAILMANNSLVASAGPNMTTGSSDQRENKGEIHIDNLTGLASDPGLSSELTGAADLWSRPGMMRSLDLGGDDPVLYHEDKVIVRDNIGAWLEKQAPKTDSDTLTFLDGAAVRDEVADVDTSKLTADVLQHPENYDGKTKAAVLVQLTDTQTRLALSDYKDNDTGLLDKYTSPNKGLNPNEDKIKGQVQDAIRTLMADKDVQGFLQNNRGPALQDIVNSDPELKIALQSYKANQLDTGNVLNTDLNAKGPDGKPLPPGVALQNAANDITIANLALGGNGDVDLHAIAEKSGQMDNLYNTYKNDFVSGQAFKDMVASGMDPVEAASSFAASASAFQAFLGPNATSGDAATLQVNFNEALSDALVNSADSNSLNITLGDANGNFDEAKVTAALNAAAEADPQLFTASDGTKIDPAQVVGMLRSVWDSGRQNDKIIDALPKAIDGLKLGNVTDAYKQGLLHIGSAILAGGVLIARSATGSNTPIADASRVSAGLQFAGLLMEGGTKYAKEFGFGTSWVIDKNVGEGIGAFPTRELTGKGPLSADAIAKLGNVGKLVGGAGSFIGGVLGIMGGIQGITHGEPVSGAFGLAGGILGTGAATASLIEGGAGLFGLSDIAAVAGSISGVLGLAGAILGGIGSAFIPFALADARGKEQDKFYGELVPILKQYGLTGGPEQPGDYPEDPIPAINT
ncbi:hypothetical protein PHLH7_50080 [Pseudomonas sp. Ost2]|uniref:type III effector HrpK domain-containing protein n=1 Tax=Pseudomonas sp. Ost2 TaxID=2678260 RepID=UPI001BB321F0|nr:type III effector HrpK domain-containing protein [Pseudomonas sp. Ost2]BBP78904.1 hypothetical protein PHLH7_50080 [Pseudomonas sp. Ost2]